MAADNTGRTGGTFHRERVQTRENPVVSGTGSSSAEKYVPASEAEVSHGTPRAVRFWQNPKMFSIACSGFIVGGFVVAGIMGAMSSGGEEERIEEIEQTVASLSATLEGESVDDAEDTLQSEGIENVVVDRSHLDSDVSADDTEVGERVRSISVAGDTAQIVAQYHPVDVINSLDVEGLRWNNAKTILNEGGMESGVEYLMVTDDGRMIVESNWAVEDVTFHDGKSARIDLTNEGLDSLKDSASDFSDTAQEKFSDFGESVQDAFEE